MSHREAGPERGNLAERYRVLLEIGRTLTGTLSPEDLYRTIYRETARVVEASGFYISVYDQARDLATVVFYADRGRERVADISFRGSDSEVIRTGRGSIILDAVQDHSLLLLGDAGEDEVTRAAIAAPLTYKGRVLGAISAQSYQADAYGPEDLELLQGIADIAAVAIENATYVAELDRRRLEAERIEEIGRALTGSLDAAEVVDKVIASATELLDADGGAVCLLEGDEARIASSQGKAEYPSELRWPVEGTFLDSMLDTRRVVAMEDLQTCSLMPDALRPYAKGSLSLAIPLIMNGEVAGALTVCRMRAEGFSEEDVHVGQRLASQAAVALANAQLHASIQALSLTDPLTGLPNRRQMQSHLEREVAAARRGRSVTLLILDLDDFKRYNDTYGHVAGDDALRAFGSILAAETRRMNLAARFGGDEFVSVLAETEAAGGRLHAERIQERVGADPVLSSNGLTVSYGLACFDPGDMTTVEDLVRAADEDLYRRKAARRIAREPRAEQEPREAARRA
jgi:diguanylate cyclase (GGDEF)-like protein